MKWPFEHLAVPSPCAYRILCFRNTKIEVRRKELTLPHEHSRTPRKSSPSRGPWISKIFSAESSSPPVLFFRHSLFFSLLASFSSWRLSEGSLLLDNFSSWISSSSLEEEQTEGEEEGGACFLCLHLRFLSSRPSPAFSLSSCIAALLLSSFLRLSRSRDLRFSVSYQ